MLESVIEGFRHNEHRDANFDPLGRSLPNMVGSATYLYFQPLFYLGDRIGPTVKKAIHLYFKPLSDLYNRLKKPRDPDR